MNRFSLLIRTFGHANIIKYSNRPFSSWEEHDEILIKNWNNMVQPGDSVYHLGDFAFRNRTSAEAIKKRLNGNIFFIEGNHDKTTQQIKHLFAWYEKVATIRIGGQDIFLSHYSHRTFNKSHHGMWHLYGHSHNSLPDTECNFGIFEKWWETEASCPQLDEAMELHIKNIARFAFQKAWDSAACWTKSFDIGIDATAARLAGLKEGVSPSGTKQEDYRPLSFAEVSAIMATKTFKPVDHHGARAHETENA